MRKVLHECCAGTMKGIIIYGYRLMENIYRIEVPLPKNPMKLLNSYLIRQYGQCRHRYGIQPSGMQRSADVRTPGTGCGF